MISCKELKENNPYLFNSWRAIPNINLDESLYMYQTSQSYNGIKDLKVGYESDTDILVVGNAAAQGISAYSNIALYSLVVIDHDTTEEERQLVIDYWKKEFPELFTNS